MFNISKLVSDGKISRQIGNRFVDEYERGCAKTKFFSSIFPETEMTKNQALNIMLRNGIVSDTLIGRIKAELIFYLGVKGDGNNGGGGQAYEFESVKNASGERRYVMYGRAFTA